MKKQTEKKRAEKKAAPRRRLRYGLLSTLLLAAMLALLAGANILVTGLEQRNAWRADLSFNRETSYGEITEAVLAKLDRHVHAYMFIDDEPLCELLNRYAAATPYFTWEKANLAVSPGLVAKFTSALDEESVSGDSIVFYCEETDRWRTVTADQLLTAAYDEEGNIQVTGLRYENAITNAVRYVTADETRRILVLQGHGEKAQDDVVNLTELWDRAGYDVWGYSFNTAETELTPADLLVILAPSRDLSDAEYAALLDFTEKGGCLLMSFDPETPLEKMPNFTALLTLYNMRPLEGVVYAAADETDSYYQDRRSWIFPAIQYAEPTIPMIQNGTPRVLLVNSRAFAMPGAVDYVYTDAVLTVDEGARLVPLSRTAAPNPIPASTDPAGPFALALMTKRITGDGNAAISRAFVIGSTGTLVNDPDQTLDLWAGIDTEELILRVTGVLFGGDSLDAGIVSKAAVRPSLTVESHAAGTLAVFMLPALVAAAAVVVLGIRRRK